MQDRPSAAELLRIAREAEFGEAPLRRELARLLALYGEAAPPDEPLAATVERLSRRLAADIRRGAFEADAAKLAEVKAHLLEVTLQKLRVNNPNYLESEGFG